MNPFSLLSEPIKKYIRYQGWEEFRPIQSAAIQHIILKDNHYILSSKTASGKTEAAFLPILSITDFDQEGVQVLYISPLIALINDQFARIEELSENLEIPITKWHGEAKVSAKNQLQKHPSGIVLITPESLEAMLCNKIFNAKKLFSNLKFVIIDEIHSFIATDRGYQLQSIIHRLQELNKTPFRIIGLSATLGDYQEAKNFTTNPENCLVLRDSSSKEINAYFKFFEKKTSSLPLDLLEDIYLETKFNKTLIFPNSRGIAEEIAVSLLRISKKNSGHTNYFSHHSSVDKEIREHIEYFAKNNSRENFVISCTSTLELGIDIGTVDQIIQVDATHSIASLIQRIGRSGRKDNQASNLILYSTDAWSLLQSTACWLLYLESFIEAMHANPKPYDILLHQILSIIKSSSGIKISQLIAKMQANFVFSKIERLEIEEIIVHLIENDILETINHELILAIEGEKLVNSRDFYSVFKSDFTYRVLYEGKQIGNIQDSYQVKIDENILLAAKIWKIVDIDEKHLQIKVIVANDGKKPIYHSSATIVDPAIREKMFDILLSDNEYDFLNAESSENLNYLRRQFEYFEIEEQKRQRPMIIKESSLKLYTFTGTKINRAINYLISLMNVKTILNDPETYIEIDLKIENFKEMMQDARCKIENIDFYLLDLYRKNTNILDFSKFGKFLPEKFIVELIKDKYFDFPNAIKFMENIEFIEMRE